ncbi:MAG: hypothetical protein PHP90_05060 [Sulfuricurvum sp.]|uniref:metallophosphoesterase n=1 Tax=Sulfuricurvum sp. TaxID=2025608 RepID=UPI0026143350|nr:metallophosphoesterase [Sulfuricurvum sp.]MDD5117941.1 hypothetical protein [Sulfuricurvum sp.]
MHLRTYSLAAAMAVLGVSLFVGCGSDSSNTSVQTGTFVDSPVKGLYYVSGSTNGTTDDNGTFKYESGKTVKFYLGQNGALLGETNGSTLVTPLDLSDDGIDGTKTSNILRVLQSLDSDGDASNGIDINITKAAKVKSFNFSDDVNVTAGLTAAGATIKTADEAREHFRDTLSTLSAATHVALIGDLPYGTSPTDVSQYNAMPTFIASINQDKQVSAILHAGDIHSGKQYCTEEYDRNISTLFGTYNKPLIYTPGDNEWTDCHKKKEGGGAYNSTTTQIDYVLDANNNPIDYASGNPVDNLNLIRALFFANPGTTLGTAMSVHSQAVDYDHAYPNDANFSENVWWEKDGVLYVAVNIPGGSNDDTDPWYGAPSMSTQQQNEVAQRSAADLRWLDVAFAKAKASGDYAMVILTQADMWDTDGASAEHISNYKRYIDKIAAGSTMFGKPVLLVNGDSHVFRSDNPLKPNSPCYIEPTPGVDAVACSADNAIPVLGTNPADPYETQPNGYNVPNFHRIVVHGSTNPMEWIKLSIYSKANAAHGKDAFGPFSWKRINQ